MEFVISNMPNRESPGLESAGEGGLLSTWPPTSSPSDREEDDEEEDEVGPERRSEESTGTGGSSGTWRGVGGENREGEVGGRASSPSSLISCRIWRRVFASSTER